MCALHTVYTEHMCCTENCSVAGPQVMQYLYKGSAEELPVQARDILELMAAANFFQVCQLLLILLLLISCLSPTNLLPQLDGLLHFCEVRCASLIDLDTIVSYYIHAKVRGDTPKREKEKRKKETMGTFENIEKYE